MSITVKVSELYERVKELHDDKMDFVNIIILDADDDPDFPAPSSLQFEAWSNKASFESVGYDPIYDVTEE